MTLPTFIVIGAAKAGTTAVHGYLAEHPDVFMSPVKETNYFAYRVDERGELSYGDPALHRFPIRSVESYARQFEKAPNGAAVGEASPIYLECPHSAMRIHAMLPRARIICGLRHPVDRAYSDYLMYLRGAGLEFDPERDLSPDAAWLRPDSHWMQVSRYHAALSRYYDLFPRDHVHVFLTEDLKRNPVKCIQDMYRFIGVDAGFVPDLDTPYNIGGMPSSLVLERAFHAAASVRGLVEPWIPGTILKWLRQLRASNMSSAPRLSAELRAQLTEYFKEDIARTAELAGIDLDHWLPESVRTVRDSERDNAPGERWAT